MVIPRRCCLFFVLPCAALLFFRTSFAHTKAAASDAKGLAASIEITQVNDTSYCQSLGAGDSRMVPLSDVCRFALTYLHELPDFMCEQTTSTTGGTVFKARVTFENGHEHYSDITINGKPFGESSSLSAERLMFFSSGELGTNLVDLFTAPVVARFRFRMQAELRNVRAWVYAFKIPASKNTFWAIRDENGAILHPEYEGELWLEHPNGRLLRLELQPVHLPKYFGFASAQTTIDYNEVHIVDAGLFLLPSKSETTACTRNLSVTICTTNVLTFQDCRKFGTKTRILYR